jgi:hypothetical protein
VVVAALSAQVVLSLLSFAVAMVALLVNVSALVRRPRIVAEWGFVRDAGDGIQPVEGLTVIVTARRRTVEVDEIGIVRLPKRTWRRRLPEWLHTERPARIEVFPFRPDRLPHVLTDGESIKAFIRLESAQDDLDKLRIGGVDYPYVRASGTVYLAPAGRFRTWRTRRMRRVSGE